MGLIEIDSNIDDVLGTLQRVAEVWPEEAEKVIERHLKRVEERAKDLAPVDTGFLKEHIRASAVQVARDVLSGEVKSGAVYSSYLEEGTRNIQGIGFLKGALEEESETLIQDLQDNLQRLLGG
jgi:HK97 gp10 family phage protein